jgi:hypothetical protein
MNNQRINYFATSFMRYFSDQSCPFCQSRSVSQIDRKYIVTRLFECQNCHLYFRHPKDKPAFNKRFYQQDYVEYGLTTNIPAPDLLEQYKASNFKNSGKDFSAVIDFIRMLTGSKPIKIVDYGASWGYTSFQFKNAGFEVQSFEISKPMARQGNDLLGLTIRTDISKLEPGNDVFFSSHVIEHLSDIHILLDAAEALILEDGFFIVYCPNGSKPFRDKYPDLFGSLWGMVHPNFLNKEFYSTIFKRNPYLIASAPYGDINIFSSWDQRSQIIYDVSGEELLIACKIKKFI